MTTIAKTRRPKPRKRSTVYHEGDLVRVGRTRWVIRVITGEHVELEVMNRQTGVWWRTTLLTLPRKVA